MMKGSKSGAIGGASKGITTTDEKGKRSQFRTRISMDFDPRTTKLHNQEEVGEYLVKYDICLSPGIKVEFSPHGADVALAPSNGGVYMHPQFMALRLRLPLRSSSSCSDFLQSFPSQLSGVAWRTVLRFEAFNALSIPEACQGEVFSAAYALRKTR